MDPQNVIGTNPEANFMISIRSWSIFFLIYFDPLEDSNGADTIELRQ